MKLESGSLALGNFLGICENIADTCFLTVLLKLTSLSVIPVARVTSFVLGFCKHDRYGRT